MTWCTFCYLVLTRTVWLFLPQITSGPPVSWCLFITLTRPPFYLSPKMEFMKIQIRCGFFLQNAVHKQTWVFFTDWLFCMGFWNNRDGSVFFRFSSFRCISKCCLGKNVKYLYKNGLVQIKMVKIDYNIVSSIFLSSFTSSIWLNAVPYCFYVLIWGYPDPHLDSVRPVDLDPVRDPDPGRQKWQKRKKKIRFQSLRSNPFILRGLETRHEGIEI